MKRSLVICGMILALAGCDLGQQSSPTEPESTSNQERAALLFSSETIPLEDLAFGISVAMEDAGIRSDVRDAMRASPWGQHVIDLRSFLESELGEDATQRMATALAVSREQLVASLKASPALDLFVPARSMRRTWRGGESVAVFSSEDFEAPRPDGVPYSGFASGGRTVKSDDLEDTVVFILQPAGRHILRYDRDRGDDSMVIEGPDEIAVRYTFKDASGMETVLTYQDLVRAQKGRDGRQLVPSSNGNTSITSIQANFCDGGGLTGDLEIRLEAEFWDETGARMGTGTFEGDVEGPMSGHCNEYFDGENYSSPYPVLIDYVLPPGASHKISIEMFEDDLFDDDEIGSDEIYYGDYSASFGSAPGDAGTVDLTYSTLSTATLSDVRLPELILPENETWIYATGVPVDQYGFGLSGYTSATGWGTANSSVATASGYSGLVGLVYVVGVGTTSYYTTVSGVQGSGTVTIEACDPECEADLIELPDFKKPAGKGD